MTNTSAMAALTPASLSTCGRMCLSGMLALHATFGCQLPAHNAVDACLCDHPDFRYGINDCSIQACGADESGQLVRWVDKTCSGGQPTGGSTTTTAADEAARTAALDFASSDLPADSSSIIFVTLTEYESTQVSSAVSEATGTARGEKENWATKTAVPWVGAVLGALSLWALTV